MGKYGKQINAAIILVLGVFVVALADGSVNTVEWLMAAVAALRGVLLFGVRPEWGKVGVYLPVIITALIGAVTQIITALQDGGGFSSAEGIGAAIVFFTAIGSTFGTSNAVESDALRTPVREAGDGTIIEGNVA
jgi:hypothetical protein